MSAQSPESTLVTGITELVTNDPGTGDGSPLGLVSQAALVVQHANGHGGHGTDADRVAWVGPAADAPSCDRQVDLGGRAVVPGFVDSHAHLVFAGDRSAEFEARMNGQPYTGGGIATTVDATRAATDDQLRSRLRALVAEMRAQGTTTVEVKSGYGLTVADEERSLQIAAEVTAETTFLGAHVVPVGSEGARGEYLDLVTGPMLAACAPHSRWVDVFCEPASPHAFGADEARAVLVAGRSAGLGLRLHAGQLAAGPGVALAVELGAASVDHCTYLSDADVDALAAARSTDISSTGTGTGTGSTAGGGTVATLLPGVEFSTRSPYPDARRLLDAGVLVALATDCNPGTSFTTSMPLCIALAVRELGMTPAEALWAATAGGARALRRDDIGHLAVGARADLAVLDAPSHRHLAYRPGVPLARTLELT